jgi:Ras-related GTP-binding protein C/D
MQSYELCCDMIDVVVDISCIYGYGTVGTLNILNFLLIDHRTFYFLRTKEADGAAFDHQSLSLIKLNNSTILYLREVNRFLALVCILREDHFARQGILLVLIQNYS